MPNMWMDVDAALSKVPVNLMPLIDDTDFKSREESLTYNQAGLDLVWNFTTTAGVTTQTAVTPTESAGDYDWTNLGNGMYAIEIPASGGASANNNTEGVGWFTGYATGVLPWRGPTIGFRAAGLNNALIDGGEVLEADVTKIHGTALTETSGQLAGRFVDFFNQSSAGYNVSTSLASFKATGFSTHAAADVVTALGTGSTLTACITATGFSTHNAAAVVSALGTGSTLTACATATSVTVSDKTGFKLAADGMDGVTLPANIITASSFKADAAEEIRNAVTGGAYALDTDANGRVRVITFASGGG